MVFPVTTSLVPGTGVPGPAFGAPGLTGPLSVTKTPPPPLFSMVFALTLDPASPASSTPPNASSDVFGCTPLFSMVSFSIVTVD